MYMYMHIVCSINWSKQLLLTDVQMMLNGWSTHVRVEVVGEAGFPVTVSGTESVKLQDLTSDLNERFNWCVRERGREGEGGREKEGGREGGREREGGRGREGEGGREREGEGGREGDSLELHQ